MSNTDNSIFLKQLNYIGQNPNESYIIVAEKYENSDKFIKLVAEKLKILPNDLLIVKSTEEKIKLSEVKKIHRKLSLSPQGNIILVSLMQAEKLTLEAANSLLKIIEEPPKNSLILIFTQNIDQIISTIVSRCIRLNIRDKISNKFAREQRTIFERILSFTKIYQKFQIAEEMISSNVDIKKLLTSWLFFLRENPTKTSRKNYIKIYQYLYKLSPNINKKLFLENLFLDLTD